MRSLPEAARRRSSVSIPVVPGVPAEFISLLILGRWIFVATIILTLVLKHPFVIDRHVLFVIAVVATAYNIAQWVLLRVGRLGSYPPAAFIGADTLLATALIWFSGNSRSPFLGLYYLLIIVAAAFGDYRGSLLTALSASGLQVLAVAFRRPGATEILRVENAVSTFPFFFLTAAVSGFLVRSLRRHWESRQAAEMQLAAVNRELEIAEEVQRALMGRPLPHVTGVTVARFSRPLYGVGGDLQDYVALPDGLGVVLADVAGHSLAAALLAVRLSQALEGVGWAMPLPDLLAAWNRTVYAYTPDDVFATAAFLQVRVADGHVRYAAAGHPPALVWRSAARRVETLGACHAPPLGVAADAAIGICDLDLAPGDLVLLYTDGASEARNADGSMLDVDGLARLLQQRGGLPPRELVARLAEDVVAGRSIRDDLTLLVVAYTPGES